MVYIVIKDYLRLVRWDKPIGTLLLLWPTLWGLWIAYQGAPPFSILFVFVMGVFLTRAAGCAINDFADRNFDGKVERTANRPLATGAIRPRSALVVTVVLSLAAFGLAWAFLQQSTLLWSIPALFLFVTYPFFKRFFPIPQLYLGVAFSFGIPMAFIEALNYIPMVAWLLFAANILWVLAYDTIYALVDLPDDLKIGIKTSAITFGSKVIEIIMLSYLGFIGLLILLGCLINAGIFYWLSLLIASAMIYYIYTQIKDHERGKCFRAFLLNNRVGLIVFVGIMINYWLVK